MINWELLGIFLAISISLSLNAKDCTADPFQSNISPCYSSTSMYTHLNTKGSIKFT